MNLERLIGNGSEVQPNLTNGSTKAELGKVRTLLNQGFTVANIDGKHHKMDELMQIEESLGDVDIHYIELPLWQIGWFEAVEINRLKPILNRKVESIWGNLNVQVIRVLAVKGLTEFILLACLGLLLVTLFDHLDPNLPYIIPNG